MYRSQKTNTRLRTPLRKGNGSIQSCWSFNGCCVRSMDALKLWLSYRSWKNLPQACMSKNMIISNTCTYLHAHVCSRNVLQHKWCWYWWEQTQSCIRLYKHMYVCVCIYIYILANLCVNMYEREKHLIFSTHLDRWMPVPPFSCLVGQTAWWTWQFFPHGLACFRIFYLQILEPWCQKTLVLLGFQSSNKLIVILLF